MHPHDRIYHAVLKGGGPRGFPYLGAIAFLEEQGYKVGEVRGTSAGAIIGSLLSIGFSANEIIENICKTDFDTFRRGRFTERFPIIQTAAGGAFTLPFDLINLALYGGFYSRRTLEAWMCDCYQQKDVDPELTFEHLPQFRAYAMDVSDRKTHRILEFSKETTKHVSVIKAVSMSSCVPLIFEPEHYEGCLVVDGAWANNIPIQSFAIEKKQDRLDAPVMVMTNQLDRPVDTSSSPPFYKLLYFIIALLKKFPLTNAVVAPAESLLDAQDEIAKQLFDHWAYFVELNSDVGVLHFGFDREKKQAVVDRGRDGLQRFWQTDAGLRFRKDVFFSQVQRVLDSMSADSKYRYQIDCEFKSPDDVDQELRDMQDETASEVTQTYQSHGCVARPTYQDNGVFRLMLWIDPRRQNWSYASLLALIERHVQTLEAANSTHVNEHVTANTKRRNADSRGPRPVRLNRLASWQSLRRQYDAGGESEHFELHSRKGSNDKGQGDMAPV